MGALDPQFDQTADGRILKLLHVVDEFIHEALAIDCRPRIAPTRRLPTVTVRGTHRRSFGLTTSRS
jgi:hypothetical protein